MWQLQSSMYSETVSCVRAGYYLEYMQQLRSETEAESGPGINWMIDRLCNFSVRKLNTDNASPSLPSQSWRQILSVYHNLLIRGCPTYPTLELERFLLKTVSKVVPIEELDDSRSIMLRDSFPSPLRSMWLKVLAQAHTAIDHQLTEPPVETNSLEEKKFIEALAQKLGPSVYQLFEFQRPFHTLVETEEAEGFYDQRVDFSLETKDTRLVVEIDGKQHEEEPQRTLDERRDRFLKKSNWEVVRISASDVKQNLIEKQLQDISERVSSDLFLVAARRSYDQPLVTHDAGRAALQLVLVPFAISRIQWAIVWAFLNGYLNTEEKTLKIAVIERDTPCAFLAFRDFIKSIDHLRSLASIKQNLPAFKLVIFRNFESTFDDGISFLEAGPRLSVTVHGAEEFGRLKREPFDLILSISMLRPGGGYGEEAIGQNPCIAINSVHSPRGMNPQIESAHPIQYHLGQKSSESLLFLLHWIFRKRGFLEGQFEILKRSLELKDMIGLLPTSGGKSLCYQLSSLLQPGMTLVVDPIISLMMDQIDNLRRSQIDVARSISSDLTRQEQIDVIKRVTDRSVLLLFVTPERLQIPSFRSALESLCQIISIPYLVVDEAHCISEWGHDFRPSYLKLADNARRFCQHEDYHPSIIALTGTASSVVLSDIQRVIGLADDAIVTPETYDRPELDFEILRCESRQKWPKLREALLRLPQYFKMSPGEFFNNRNGGIIFCPHVGWIYGIVEIANRIRKELQGVIPDVKIYSGSAPKGYSFSEWKQIKTDNQRAFKENQVPLIVATKAFGMGIDKPNIRYTIHYNMPTSLEAFYQEAGRAGRDGSRAVCSLILSAEPSKWREYFDPTVGAEDLAQQVSTTLEKDDIYRMLYFHTSSWHGIEREFQAIMSLVNSRINTIIQSLDYDETTVMSIPFESEAESEAEDDSRVTTEKMLYRLSLLGLVKDYTLDHNARVFGVEVTRLRENQFKSVLLEYICRYKPAELKDRFSERIDNSSGSTVLEKCLRVLLEFVYEEIEKKRRRTIFQMAEVASTSVEKEAFRRALLNYLETSEFTKKLDKVSREIVPSEWVDIASNIEDVNSAHRLLGGCRRALESYPDHPGLLMLSSYARLMTSDETAIDEFERSIKALAGAPLEETVRLDMLTKILELISHRRPSIMSTLCLVMLRGFPSTEMAKVALSYSEEASEAGALALEILLGSTLDKARLVVRHFSGGEST